MGGVYNPTFPYSFPKLTQTSSITDTFAATRYFDFDRAGGTRNGLTPATAWNSYAEGLAAEWTPIASTNTPFSQLWIVSGTNRGSDQCIMDAFSSGRVAAGAISRLGIRAWLNSDGARPSGNPITRPIMRPDVVFSTLTLVSGTIYKSNVIPAGNTDLSQVLFKAGQASQLDADGAWKIHMNYTGVGTLADAVIAANLLAAGDYSAYYKSDTREVFVNTNNCSTTITDWSWVPTSNAESWSKISTAGFNLICEENIDCPWGDRGSVVFDARAVRTYGLRCLENKTHNYILSYSNWQCSDVVINNVYCAGGGKTSVGGTMLAVGGQAGGGTNDLTNVVITNPVCVRYMLQSPGGTRYVPADYSSYFFGVQTSISFSNVVRNCLIQGAQCYDVSVAKTNQLSCQISNNVRHQPPADKTVVSSYPLIYRNCYFSIFGGVFDSTLSGSANDNCHAFAFDNSRIFQTTGAISTIVGTLGYRTASLFDVPAGWNTGAATYVGLFNGSQWIVNLQNGDAANRCAAIGVKDDGTKGNYIFLTARNSTILAMGSGTGQINVFDQSVASTAGGIDKGLALDIQNCLVGIVNPAGHPANQNMLCFQDAPATGNNGRIFQNCAYYNIDQTTQFSSSNTSLASWIANVDPAAVMSLNCPLVNVDRNPPILQIPNIVAG